MPSPKAKGDADAPMSHLKTSQHSAPSSSRLALINHCWPPDKMAISCLRKIMWEHSNDLVLKHRLVNALVSHASAVQFLGVN